MFKKICGIVFLSMLSFTTFSMLDGIEENQNLFPEADFSPDHNQEFKTEEDKQFLRTTIEAAIETSLHDDTNREKPVLDLIKSTPKFVEENENEIL